MSEHFRAAVTNEQVAEDLGISGSMVSLIRSGKRFPSVRLMERIKDLTRWKVDAQARVFGTAQYSRRFEELLDRHYNAAVELDPVGAEGANDE